MNDWLDDLSEEWPSNPPSLAASQRSRTLGSSAGLRHDTSQRRASMIGTRTPSQSNGNATNRMGSLRRKAVLSPRSASDENSMMNGLRRKEGRPSDKSQKSRSYQSGTLSCDSPMENMGTVAMTSSPKKQSADDDVPDWKRRLLLGDKGYRDQTDLFGPPGIQSIFQKPSSKDAPQTRATGLSFLKGLEKMPSSPPYHGDESAEMEPDDTIDEHRELLHTVSEELEQPQSDDAASIHDFPGLAVEKLARRNEDADDVFTDDMSALGSVIHPRTKAMHSATYTNSLSRSRLVSGQSVQSYNDSFSAVYIGRHRNEDGNVTYAPVEVAKGSRGDLKNGSRILLPSRSSAPEQASPLRRASAESPFKSDDLPDDLPRGTPDALSMGDFVTTRRGANADIEDSFIRARIPSYQNRLGSGADDILSGSAEIARDHEETTRLPTEAEAEAVSANSLPKSAAKMILSDESQKIIGKARIASDTGEFGGGTLDDHEFPEDLSHLSESFLVEDLPSRSPSPDVLPPGFQRPFPFRVESAGSVSEAMQNDTFKGKRKLSKLSARSTLSVSKRKSGRPSETVLEAEGTSQPRSPVGQRLSDGKRPPPSPSKNPTPKRRRTLMDPDLERLAQVDAQSQSEQADRGSSQKAQALLAPTILALGKRKDARHGSSMLRAGPDVLAQRDILQPRNPTPTQKRKVSNSDAAPAGKPLSLSSNPRMATIRRHLEEPLPSNAATDVVQAHKVASEVAAFSQSISHRMKDDSRKRSVTTQDFLDEAMKIMSFIRNNGRPNSGLGNLHESHLEDGEDMDEGGDEPTADDGHEELNQSQSSHKEKSTGKWRERPGPQRRPSLLYHLNQYKETETEDFMASSIGSNLGQRVKRAVSQYENLQSDPPGMAVPKPSIVTSHKDNISLADGSSRSNPTTRSGLSSQTSVDGTTGRTIGSRKSESVAVLPPEAVAHLIPKEVAGMTFDREHGLWRKRKDSRSRDETSTTGSTASNEQDSSELNISEEDPLRSIPDLTFDEVEEARRLRQQEIDINTVKEAMLRRHMEHEHSSPRDDAVIPSRHRTRQTQSQASLVPTKNSDERRLRQDIGVLDGAIRSSHSAESFEHEIKIDEDRAGSKGVNMPSNVTISFPANLSASIRSSSATIDRKDFGVLHDPNGGRHTMNRRTISLPQTLPMRPAARIHAPLSVLDELSELSMLNVQTPAQKREMVLKQSERLETPNLAITVQSSPAHHSELTFFMSELSDFTVHQSDERQITTRSRTAASSKTEDRYAWGNHVLVKALQDVESDQPYWEDLRAVNLSEMELSSLHMLDELCPRLENIDLNNNAIQQLSGAPASLRCIDICRNSLTSLSWWGHLTNLQYLDISCNKIDNLTGLACLIHLRELKADHNRIDRLDGLHGLDGLLKLSLRNNALIGPIDFEGSQLSRLETLDLGNNSLTALSGLQWLGALKNLRLDHNVFQEFDVSQQVATRVEVLDLASNHLRSFDLSHGFPALKDIRLDYNQLTAPGMKFGAVQHLEHISLRSQKTGEAQFSLPRAFPDTVTLDLSLNDLRPDALLAPSSLLSLRCLELSNCGLSELPETFGLRAPNLRFINLNFNAVKDLQPLLNMHHLTHLFCSGNRLSRLRKTMAVLAKLPLLQVVDLRANPFTIGFHDPALLSLTTTGDSALLTGFASVKMPAPVVPSAIFPPDLLSGQLQLPWHDAGAEESAYLLRLDADTRLRRRVYEMMLATSCRALRYLDGRAFARAEMLARDEVWERLVALGVLTRRTERSAAIKSA